MTRPQDGDPVLHDCLTRFRTGTIAALLCREIDNDRARLHRSHHILADQQRRPLSRHLGGGNHDVSPLDMLVQHLLLTLPRRSGDVFGVSAFGRGLFFQLHADK